MADEAGVVDGAAADTGAEDLEIDAGAGADDGSGAGADGAEGGAAGGEGDAAAAGAGESPGAVLLDPEGTPLKLSPAAKAELDKLKATNAPLAKEMRTALFETAAVRKEFPGGAREAVELKRTWDALGGEQGVGELREDLDYLKGIDNQFSTGDPKLVETLYKASPEGFSKLVQPMFSKFAEVNPKGFAALFGRVFSSDMGNAGIPLAMLRMQDMIKAVAAVPAAAQQAAGMMDMWKKLAGYIDRVSDYAEQPVYEAPKGGGGEGGEAGGGDLAARETALTQREWTGEREGAKTQIFQREFARIMGTRKITTTQRDAIMELFDGRLRKALAADPRHKTTVDAFFAAKNKGGYLKHMKTAYGAAIPRALAAAINAVLPAKPGPKTAAGAAAAAGGKGAAAAGAAGARGAAATGGKTVTRVAAKPALETINHSMRTKDMVRAGIFPLKNGQTVQYTR